MWACAMKATVCSLGIDHRRRHTELAAIPEVVRTGDLDSPPLVATLGMPNWGMLFAVVNRQERVSVS